MTLERLKELTQLEDEEQLTQILGEIEDGERGLVRTKDSLLSQVKALKEKVKAFDGVDLGEYAEMQEELEQLRQKATTGNGGKESAEELRAMEERLTRKFSDQLSKKDEELGSVRKRLHTTLIGQELRSALEQVGVAEEHRDLIFNAFRNRAKAEEIEGDVVVQLETPEGLALSPSEYFKDWSASDQGKRYIKAPVNSGGSATGGRNGKAGGQKEITRSEFEKMDHPQRAKFFEDGGTVA